MRMKLYEFEIERADETVLGYIVASTERQAAAMVTSHDLALEKNHQGFTLERVDRKQPLNRKVGLKTMLSAGVAGSARYADSVGWLVDPMADDLLRFFKVITPEGKVTYLVAVDENEAAAIYCDSYELAEGEHRLFKILDGMADLPDERRRGLAAIMKSGRASLATHNEEVGWSVLPRR